MDTGTKAGIICVTILLCLLILFCVGTYSDTEKRDILDQKCQDLGYSEYTFKMGFKFCEDEIGSLHYIDYECYYKIEFLELFPKDCDLNKITVGEVEVKKK